MVMNTKINYHGNNFNYERAVVINEENKTKQRNKVRKHVGRARARVCVGIKKKKKNRYRQK